MLKLLLAIDPHHAALVDGERKAAFLERQSRFAEQFAAPAVQGADVGVIVGGDLFEIVHSRDHLAGDGGRPMPESGFSWFRSYHSS